MKAAAFEYVRPASVDEAVGLLADRPEAKPLAGGQTLGPMLNLRLARPLLLVDLARIPELARLEQGREWISIGATVTHAAIEDRRAGVDGRLGAFLARVAGGIAYRAVRTRGTVGGSIAHADPAADWLACFLALGAEVAVAGRGGERRIALEHFVAGVMTTELGPGELVRAIRVPRTGNAARFGFHKICRKTGEFAEAIGAVAFDETSGTARLVAAGGEGMPAVLDGSAAGMATAAAGPPDRDALEAALSRAGADGDPYALRLRAVALRRAMAEALAA